MDEAGISANAQNEIYKGGFDTRLSFACLDETSAGIRSALKQHGLELG